jgi:hypothetical protein
VREDYCNIYASGTVSYALQMGVPVVSTPLNYAAFYVRDESQGYLVEKGTWRELEAAIGHFFTVHSQKNRLEQYRKLFCRGRVGSFDQLGEQYFAVFAIERLYGAGE